MFIVYYFYWLQWLVFFITCYHVSWWIKLYYIFRWGGKRLHNFATNLFRKQQIKFHQNRPSFVEDITKKHFGSFFLRHSVEVIYILLLIRSSSEWPPVSPPLSVAELAALLPRDLRLLTGLKLAYKDLGRVPTLRGWLRDLERRPSDLDLDLDLRRLLRLVDTRCAPETYVIFVIG